MTFNPLRAPGAVYRSAKNAPFTTSLVATAALIVLAVPVMEAGRLMHGFTDPAQTHGDEVMMLSVGMVGTGLALALAGGTWSALRAVRSWSARVDGFSS